MSRILQVHGEGEFFVALVEEANFKIIADIGVVSVKRRSSHARNLSRDWASVEINAGGESEQTKKSEDKIKINSGAQDVSFFPFQAVHRVVTNEAFGATDFGHDQITGVNASGAANALKLKAVADINARRTNVDTTVAIYAVARIGIVFFAARFATFFVVSDDHGIVVSERGLNTAVRTNENAKLFAKMREAEIKSRGEAGDD